MTAGIVNLNDSKDYKYTSIVDDLNTTKSTEELLFEDTSSKEDYDNWQELSKTHDKVNNGEVYLCTDGKDDGKINGKEKTKMFLTGCKNAIVNQVKGIAKHPILAGGIVAGVVGAVVLGGPVALAVLGVIGVAGAAIGVGKGIHSFAQANKQAKNAKTDHEAKQAYEQMGGATTEITENVILGVVSAGQASAAISTIKAGTSATTAIASSGDDILRITSGSADDAAKAAASSTDDAAKAAAGATDDTARAAAGATDDTARAAAGATDDTARAAAGATDDTAKAAAGATDDTARAAAGATDDTAKATAGATDDTAKAAAGATDDTAKAAAGATDDTAKAAAGATDDTAKATASATDDTAKAAADTTDDITKTAANETDDITKTAANTADDSAAAASKAEQVRRTYKNLMDEAPKLIEEFKTNPKMYKTLLKKFHPDIWNGYVSKGYISQAEYEEIENIMKIVNAMRDASKAA